MSRPDFNLIKDYQEFSSFYWYREELIQICKSLGIAHDGNKKDLEHYIKEYFNGNKILAKKKVASKKIVVKELTLDSIVSQCGFSFNQRFRDFFINITGNNKFKFNADMVASVKKAKEENDISFTLGDLLDVGYGKKEYAKYDKSSCQWNQFLKDFCLDKANDIYENKLAAASVLWHEIKNSTKEKKYSRSLTLEFKDKLKRYIDESAN